MKKFLQWVLISCLSGCVILDKTDVSALKPVLVVKDIPVEQEYVEIENTDDDLMLGWIEIEGVLFQGFVQGKDNREYLYRNADGTSSRAGANFLDYRCTFDSDNLIIYGHSSRTSDILFTCLMDYLDEEFARSHDTVILHVQDKCWKYQLLSVFLFSVKLPSENDWMTIDYEKAFLRQKAIERIHSRSMHSFEFIKDGQLLTLVTCNTENHDERLILVAVKVS